MVFSSALFLFYFLPLFLVLYWLTPYRFKNLCILLASLLFYIWGAPLFIFPLLGSIVLDYFIALEISRTKNSAKKWLLYASLLLNLGLLAYFKYSNFFVENLDVLFQIFGIAELKWTKVILPIGLSFFTFQKMSYIIDVYRNKTSPLKNIADLALYILLFPQLIAGPIVRYSEIKDQISSRKKAINADNTISGLYRFSIGLAKKMLIANQIGELADKIFSLPPDSLTMGQAWLGAVAYSFQIYFDFSAYSDMAIGLGLVMGFKLPENFNMPYIARNITDFWRRWHITLSAWMRDYLYIPLGGNRVKRPFRLYLNLWIVFILSGIWHGAAWTFLIWGIYHGLFLVLDRIFLKQFSNRIPKVVSILFTYILLLVGWVIFRADTLQNAFNHIFAMFNFGGFDLHFTYQMGTPSYYIEQKFVVLLVICIGICFLPIFKHIENLGASFPKATTENKVHISRTLIALAFLFICMTEIISSDFNPFIYFRF